MPSLAFLQKTARFLSAAASKQSFLSNPASSGKLISNNETGMVPSPIPRKGGNNNVGLWSVTACSLTAASLYLRSAYSTSGKDEPEYCFWCESPLDPKAEIKNQARPREQWDCTLTVCKTVEYVDLIEACKVFLNDKGRFHCNMCLSPEEVFEDVKQVKKHYGLQHLITCRRGHVCRCKACFSSESARLIHQESRSRYRCPINQGENMKQYNARFQMEAWKAVKVKKQLQLRGLWEDD